MLYHSSIPPPHLYSFSDSEVIGPCQPAEKSDPPDPRSKQRQEEGVDDVNGRQLHRRRMEQAELGVNLGSLGREEDSTGNPPPQQAFTEPQVQAQHLGRGWSQ